MRQLKITILHSEARRHFAVRCVEPLTWLKGQGAVEITPPEKVWEADVAFLPGIQRWPGSLGLIRTLQRSGIRVVADCDEDVLAVKEGRGTTRIRRLLGMADAITVPTGALAESLSHVNDKVVVAPNGIDLNSWAKVDRFGARKQVRTVGFCGTDSHAANLDLLRPVLAKLSHEFKVQGIRFACFGIRPTWLAGTVSNTVVTEVCSGSEYPAMLAKLKIDIALAPLAHSQFDRSRSALKFYEYAAVGAVTIASDYGEFGTAIQDGSTGILVDNQPDSWLRAIRRLVRNNDLRLQLLESARKESLSHDVGVTAPRLFEALETTQPNRNRTVFAFPRTQTGKCPDVDVVLPVPNQSSLARRTLEAVLPELSANHRLVIVVDAATEPEAASVLDEFSGRPWITVDRTHRHRSVLDVYNFAMQELVRPNADAILMKADAEPMPGFISRLGEVAASNADIGTVTAVSNNGSIASVPDLRDAQELAAKIQTPLLVAPTISSHLLYIKRQVFEKHGVFDAGFSSEGAAEIDFSLRIIEDYANVIDPGCWCKRAGSPAFRELVKLSAEDRALLGQKHPHFGLEEAVYTAADPLQSHRVQMINATRDPRPRVLQVLHSYVGGGGTEKHVQDLESAIANHFLSFGTAPHDTLNLYCGTMPVAAWPYEKAGWPLTSSNVPANDPAWLEILQKIKPSLIHFHHLLNHPLSLLTKLSGTGIPIIVSIHDYYFLCPDYHLQHCPGVHSCDTCFPQQFKGPAQYQALRRDLLSGSLRTAAAIVAPSHAAANLVRDVYPDLNIRVIPHGIHDPEALHRSVQRLRGAQHPTEKIRFGMIGNLLPVKGIEVIFKVWPLVARQNSAELHIYGTSDPMYVERCAELGIHYHGPYTATDLPQMLSEIDIGILPAQARETFSYTLSEFFAAGIPVIGSDYGALSDRIEQGVNGLKVAPTDIQAWIDAISLTASDPALRERLKRGVRLPDSLDRMAVQYAELYREVMQCSMSGISMADNGANQSAAVRVIA